MPARAIEQLHIFHGSQDTKLELREIQINVKLDRSPVSNVTKGGTIGNFGPQTVHSYVTLHRGCPHGSHDEG